jgi:hypothetical protein
MEIGFSIEHQYQMLGVGMGESEQRIDALRAPKFSVIMPLYNKAPWVRRAIDSVIAQRVEEWELIVIDDGSTDGGGDIVASMADPRIVLITQKNQGVSSARNAGILLARGDWVAFLDADDRWLPRCLIVFEGLMGKYPDAMWLAAGFAEQEPGGQVWARGAIRVKERWSDSLIGDALTLLNAWPFCVGSVAVRKWVFEEVGLFDEMLRVGEDPDMWFRIAMKFPAVAYSREIVAIYHWAPLSLMRRGNVDVESQERLLARYKGELRTLSGERRGHVREIIRGRIHSLVRDLLLGSRSADAKAVCKRHKAFISRGKMMVYRTLILLPVGLEEYRFLSGRHFRLHAVTAQDLGQAADPPKTSRAIEAMPAPSVH